VIIRELRTNTTTIGIKPIDGYGTELTPMKKYTA
jgi:hypothetical protein